jgi:hypothetical protein
MGSRARSARWLALIAGETPFAIDRLRSQMSRAGRASSGRAEMTLTRSESNATETPRLGFRLFAGLAVTGHSGLGLSAP